MHDTDQLADNIVKGQQWLDKYLYEDGQQVQQMNTQKHAQAASAAQQSEMLKILATLQNRATMLEGEPTDKARKIDDSS